MLKIAYLVKFDKLLSLGVAVSADGETLQSSEMMPLGPIGSVFYQ
jgi:hypothetical protein